jgi:hypothetical protein
MDIVLDYLTLQSVLVGLVVLLLVLWLRDLKHGLHMPPGPMQWPVVGSLPSVALFGSKDFLGYLKSLGKKHGGLFTLKLGDYQTVFITDYEVMKECLVKQGSVFSVRPEMEMSRALRDGGHKRNDLMIVKVTRK